MKRPKPLFRRCWRKVGRKKKDPMKKKEPSHFRDYSFDEWENLPFEIKRDIWNNYWNPYKPEIGKITREALLDEFRRRYLSLAKKAVDIGYDYFGWNVGAIYVVVQESSMQVPKEFSSVMVNKGVVTKIIDEKNLQVNWRYGGSKTTYSIDSKNKR